MIYIIGASHTAVSAAVMLGDRCRIFSPDLCPDPRVAQNYSKHSPEEVMLMAVPDAFLILFDEDSKNVKYALTVRRTHGDDVPVYTIITQDSLSEKVGMCIKNFHPINPADKASDSFLESALGGATPKETKLPYSIHIRPPDSLTKSALMAIGSIMASATVFFKFALGLSWIDAFYFTTTTMATVGYGDYSLQSSPDFVKVVGSAFMMVSVVGVAIVIALVSDTIIRKRKELSMGKISYSGRGHVLVVGGGSVGYYLCRKLLAAGERPVVLDKSITGKYAEQLVSMGVPYLIGDAKDERNLVRAGVGRCKSLVCVTQDDLTNLEVGIDARQICPDLRVVLRIYDQELAQSLRDMVGIHHTYSMSLIAAKIIVGSMPDARSAEDK